jgi:hypothetical protein
MTTHPNANQPADAQAVASPGFTTPALNKPLSAIPAPAPYRLSPPSPIDGSDVALRVLAAQAANGQSAPSSTADAPEAKPTAGSPGDDDASAQGTP